MSVPPPITTTPVVPSPAAGSVAASSPGAQSGKTNSRAGAKPRKKGSGGGFKKGADRHILDSDSLLTVFHWLWKFKDRLNDATSLPFPDTIVYEHHFPRGWYSSNAAGPITKRSVKDCDSASIFDAFTRSRGRSEIVASFCCHNPRVANGPTGGNGTADELEIVYLNQRDLSQFLLKPPEKGILQQFLAPNGEQNDEIRITWTPFIFFAERWQNKHSITDQRFTLAERTVTENVLHSTKVCCAPNVAATVRTACESLVADLQRLERKHMTRMILHFKLDDRMRLWLLRAPRMEVIDGPPKIDLANPHVNDPAILHGLHLDALSNSNRAFSKRRFTTRSPMKQTQLTKSQQLHARFGSTREFEDSEERPDRNTATEGDIGASASDSDCSPRASAEPSPRAASASGSGPPGRIITPQMLMLHPAVSTDPAHEAMSRAATPQGGKARQDTGVSRHGSLPMLASQRRTQTDGPLLRPPPNTLLAEIVGYRPPPNAEPSAAYNRTRADYIQRRHGKPDEDLLKLAAEMGINVDVQFVRVHTGQRSRAGDGHAYFKHAPILRPYSAESNTKNPVERYWTERLRRDQLADYLTDLVYHAYSHTLQSARPFEFRFPTPLPPAIAKALQPLPITEAEPGLWTIGTTRTSGAIRAATEIGTMVTGTLWELRDAVLHAIDEQISAFADGEPDDMGAAAWVAELLGNALQLPAAQAPPPAEFDSPAMSNASFASVADLADWSPRGAPASASPRPEPVRQLIDEHRRTGYGGRLRQNSPRVQLPN
eukprot:TRINITY_DN14268_c0_g1_i1.p1 TRINITY_DN14268_c0_g1~~TRINITY_DN14268_c0_g1_i1.p1  ORF type:complete len:789 (-),score=66.85 TRINITY_DN14268_c0_g1_i1:49-2364(-)